MKKTTTLGEVTNRVHEMAQRYEDHHVPVSDISFDGIENVNIDNKTYPMKPIAQRSISNRLGIPYQYLVKCPADIQAANLNHWIGQEKNENLFFRFDGNQVRAIFTPRYVPVDHFEVIERLDSLGFGPETSVQCHLDDEFMMLSIPDGEKAFSVKGYKYKPGLAISNSEVGLGCLSVSAFVLRLICTNGMISAMDFSASYRHVSSKILVHFPEILGRVSGELSRQQSLLKFSMESPVDDPEQTIKSFNRQFGLRKEEIEAVDWAWPYEAGGMMSQIVNTYTRAARYDGLTAESGYRLQKVGGNILAMVN